MGFPGGTSGKEPGCQCRRLRDVGSVLGLGRSLVEGHGYPLQCSGLENSVGCIFHGVAKSQTLLSDFTVTFSLLEDIWVKLIKNIKKCQ